MVIWMQPKWAFGSFMRSIDGLRIPCTVRAFVRVLAVAKSIFVPVPFKANWWLSRGWST